MKDAWKDRFVTKFLRFGIAGIVLIMIPVATGATHVIPLFIVPAAILLTIPLLEVIEHLAPGIYGSNQWRSRPKPTFSIARGLKKQEKFGEALEVLERLAREEPQETDIWLEMLEIALMDIKDRDIAESIYRDALSVLENQDSRTLIARFYTNITQA